MNSAGDQAAAAAWVRAIGMVSTAASSGGMVRVRRRGCVFLRFHVTFCLTGTFAAD
ncbi:hypothetical protein JCM18916_3933 [Cutibacterium acnes JCM 18916]|nr:hypothetical protein JCM18916_3933 [Cutibacterium acnes JCM 18916]